MKKRRWLKGLLIATNIGAVIGLLLSYLATYVSPIDFWPLAFFGLGYPLLLLLNIIFILFWWWRGKRKLLVVSLIAILLGANHLINFVQVSGAGSATFDEQPQLKVMSFNVRLFDLYNRGRNRETRDQIFQFLQEQDADIYCFQEYYQTDEQGRFETTDTLITFLRANQHHGRYQYFERGKQHFGVATFSAWPIVGKGEVEFDRPGNNFCIYSDLKVKDDTIRVYNMHLASIRFAREDYDFIENPSEQDVTSGSRKILTRLKRAFVKRAQQTNAITAHISTSPYPVLVCGDFNDTPISYCYREFTRELSDAFKESGIGIGNTYAGEFPSFRIDYILHSPEILSYGYETAPHEFSDHYPISCWVEWEPQ